MAEYETDPGDGLTREVVGSWVEDKHRLLGYYVDSSRGARADLGGNPCFVDLYCGPSRVRIRDTQKVRDGSPLIAIKASMHPSKGTAAPYSSAFVADLAKSNVDASKARISALPFAVKGFEGPAEVEAPKIARALPRKGLHLALLDPYDLGTLAFSIMRAFSAVPHVDLVIHFSTSDLRRNLDDPKQAARFEEVAPGWSEQNKRCGTRERRHRFFEYWTKLMHDECRYHIAKPVSIRNRKHSEMYVLTVASKHPLGRHLWDSLKSSPQGELL
jgi:three-Cys-motif partner protein